MCGKGRNHTNQYDKNSHLYEPREGSDTVVRVLGVAVVVVVVVVVVGGPAQENFNHYK